MQSLRNVCTEENFLNEHTGTLIIEEITKHR